MKRCTICGETKPYAEFHRQASRPDGHGTWCKPCKSVRKKAAYHANPEPVKAKMAAYRRMNSEQVSAVKKRCYQNKLEKYKAQHRRYYEENREEALANGAAYRARNKVMIGKRDRKYVRTRMASDPLFRLTYAVRNRIFHACRDRRITQGTKTAELVGCDWQTLKVSLEGKFQPGMSWDNYGKWHVDHKTPLASAGTDAEMFALCHYTNLQPMWAEDNMRKGAKLAA